MKSGILVSAELSTWGVGDVKRGAVMRVGEREVRSMVEVR